MFKCIITKLMNNYILKSDHYFINSLNKFFALVILDIVHVNNDIIFNSFK